jgi:hypothetical protein
MGDLNDRHVTVDSLWEKSADRVFAVGPAGWLPIDGKAARHIYFMIASADATGARFDPVPIEDGLDHSQKRARFIGAIKALGPRVIRDFDNEADFIEFCATTWPGEKTARLRAIIEAEVSAMEEEAEVVLAEKFLNIKKQVESFVLDRTREALTSSRVMSSFWREGLQIQSDFFADDMNSLDASATINQAKVRALGLINHAFSMGVLIGRSVPDDIVAQILDAARLIQIKAAHDRLAEESKKKIAAFDRAMPVAKNWDEVCALVNKDLDQKIYKNGNSARVAYANMKKTVDKKRND